MDLPYLSICAGIVAFVLVLCILKIIFKTQQINPLLGFGGVYVFLYFLTGKLFNSVPESWKIKQIDNQFLLDGSIGFLLHLGHPRLSAYELASTTFKLCLIGYFIYVFSFRKGSWKKVKRRDDQTRQGPRL